MTEPAPETFRSVAESAEIPVRKRQMRKEMKAVRAAIPDDVRLHEEASLREALFACPEWKNASRVFLYLSAGAEVDTRGLIRTALHAGKTIAVPKTEGRPGHGHLHFYDIHPDQELTRGAFGIYEPTGEGERVTPVPGDLIILPGVAFDEDGNRLGYGGGYYDRFLDDHAPEGVHTMGLAFSCQMVDRVPHETHDRPLESVMTPHGLIRPRKKTRMQDFLENFILEEDVLAESQNVRRDRLFLWFRNLFVLGALILFLVSLFSIPHPHMVRGIAYFFGAAAYFSEILLVTGGFRKRLPSAEMFMAYCFGPLYVLLGLTYLFGH